MGNECGAPPGTVLYQVLAEYVETFLARASPGDEGGFGLPRFVERELRGFLDCGILARGFCRVHCTVRSRRLGCVLVQEARLLSGLWYPSDG